MKRRRAAALASGIAAVGVAATIATVSAPAQPTAPADRPALGFDHLSHDGHVAVSGAPPIACDKCHVLDRRGRVTGRPDHSACYGACHGPLPPRRRPGKPYPIDEERRFICSSCHSPTAIARVEAGSADKLTVFYPPYGRERDYGIALSHAAHDQATRDRGGCLVCHIDPGAPPPPRARKPRPAHDRCIVCHQPGSAELPIGACTTCHPAAFGYASRPHRDPGPYPVTSKFSHRNHRERGPGESADPCRTCHVAITTTTGNEIPSPTTSVCASCHDGSRAFSTHGTDCRRCHEAPRERITRHVQTQLWFSHRDHQKRGLTNSCRDCHRLDAAGLPLPTAADHSPCADAGCHREEFSSPTPTICRTCHVGSEPWRPLHAERRPAPRTEFGARFAHLTHLGGDRPLISAPCTSCHREKSATRDMRLPRDHRACAGPDCHQSQGKVAPDLDDCGGCHALGIVAKKLRVCASKPWSVRGRFRHQPHIFEPGTNKPVDCSECHRDVATSTTIDTIGAPTKAQCLRCHDGETAFKVTGHNCARCHGR